MGTQGRHERIGGRVNVAVAGHELPLDEVVRRLRKHFDVLEIAYPGAMAMGRGRG